MKVSMSYKDVKKDLLTSSGHIDLTTKGAYCEDDITINFEGPTGLKEIEDTSIVDVTNFATAQVKDDNLKAEVIAKGVKVLGITGTHEGGITPTGNIELQKQSGTDVTTYATASVKTGTQGDISLRKNVNNHTATVTAEATDTTGWINGTTKNKNISISASELVSGSLNVAATTETETHDVTNYAEVNVNPTPSQEKSITSNGEFMPDEGKLFSKVTVNVGSGIAVKKLEVNKNGTYEETNTAYKPVIVNVPTGTQRSSSDLTVNGATVNVPAGLYESAASKSVATGRVTASATKSAVSNHSVTITPSASVTAGYIASGTTGDSITVNASELVSGTKTITAGTNAINNIDVVDYEKVNVNPTPTEPKTVTPNASGFIVTPSSDHHLSQVQVNGDSNLTAPNIAKNVTIFGVTGTHEGGVTPTGTLPIVSNDKYDVTNYAEADVAVPSPTNQMKYYGHRNWALDECRLYGTTSSDEGWTNYDGVQLPSIGDLIVVDIDGKDSLSNDIQYQNIIRVKAIENNSPKGDTIAQVRKGEALGLTYEGGGGNYQEKTVTLGADAPITPILPDKTSITYSIKEEAEQTHEHNQWVTLGITIAANGTLTVRHISGTGQVDNPKVSTKMSETFDASSIITSIPIPQVAGTYELPIVVWWDNSSGVNKDHTTPNKWTLTYTVIATGSGETYDALSKVNLSIDTDVIKPANIAKNVTILGVTGTHEGGGIVPTGTINITENGTVDVTNYANANVNVQGGSANIGHAEKTLSAAARSITFDVEGEPTWFMCNITTDISGSTSRRIAFVNYDGENIFGACFYTTSSWGSTSATMDYQVSYSQSYSNGVLTITSTGSNNETFLNSKYNLVYGY